MDLKGKKVLVIGLARSGLAAIKVLHHLGAEITLSETKPRDQLPEADELESMGVKITDQSMPVFEEKYDLAVKNPGVPYRAPTIMKLKENGVPVITEIELAYKVSKPQHFMAITGSNGKTTTSTLLYGILNKAFGEKAHLCGNIGIALCEMVMDYNLFENEGHWFALEVSNFQLVDIDEFRPEVATIINLSPDHIDFMGGLDNYYKSKTEVYRNMRDDDEFILNTDDSTLMEYVSRYPVKCKVNTFSLDRDDTDSYISDGYIYIRGEKVMPLSVIKLVGKHNVQNVMVAVAAAKAAGISNEIITQAVSEFKGVEHRIEFVRELGGVRYYNDSKGTNTDATVTAVKSFDRGVILLVGGFEKGLPMDELRKNLSSVKQVIGYGACGERLIRELAPESGILVTTLNEAVARAHEIAVPGDTVLLSPTTSSFDQYSCFEERGDHFKELVNSL